MGFFEVFAGALAAFYAVVPVKGIAIILLTVAVRVILLPLTIKQTRSMREMARIQPEVKKIQQKYKGKPDRQKMNEEMMALYKEHGVNPFGGCLPLLLQMPAFIALYRVLLTPLAYMGFTQVGPGRWEAQAGLDGVMAAVQRSDLANDLLRIPDEVNAFIGIRLDCTARAAGGWGAPPEGVTGCGADPLNALPYLVLIGLMGFTTWFQQKQMMASRGGSQDPQMAQMQMIGKIMPIFLMFIGFQFPAGLILYWVTTNVWTIGQQWVMLTPGAVGAGAQKDAADKAEKKPDGKPQTGKPTSERPGGGSDAQPGLRPPREAGSKSSSKKKRKKKRKR